eukprot:CAMPEP_0206143672 /NCGR_PEP_ID=MMETSP1473-20131121/21408_1 /ASSEMBLY_ACC=CAM_ASM_001109 /TAXON_ID=1461547 /ORGANISM="Stichococcus sp, Strain RCC1054" /LENGTH=80 /DNA_ID=CAMNT_0053539179 /DNA_START=323 /DNA_END=562 /DNA_ORIENTATION=-
MAIRPCAICFQMRQSVAQIVTLSAACIQYLQPAAIPADIIPATATATATAAAAAAAAVVISKGAGKLLRDVQSRSDHFGN